MPLGEFDIIARYFSHTTPRTDVLLGVGDDAALLIPPAGQALVAAIRGRAQQGSSFLDALAAKHGGAAGKRSSKQGEPTEEEFAAAKARVKRKT